jgi:uncharacterized membrane protein YedE/YeeE
MKTKLLTALLGVLLGFVLSRIGFSSWTEVHHMFLFSDLRMFLAFCVAVAALMIASFALERIAPSYVIFSSRPIQRGTLLGGALFGIGWALSGACPSIVFVQLGEGQFAALCTLAGILAGNYLFGVIRTKYLHWDSVSCIDE